MPARRLSFLALALVTTAAWAQLGLNGFQSWDAASTGLAMVPEAGAWLGNAAVAADFDGDGYDDLALALPRGSVGGDAVAGEVLVLYGADGGLSVDGHQLWNQDSDGVAGSAEPNDFFGWALAAGDFDADGFAELVIGVPFEDLGGFESAGAIHVLRGSAAGLSVEGALYFDQGSAGVSDDSEPGDQFGAALATGDFDNDGFDDLALGAPGESQEGVPSYVDLGALHVLFGTAEGLSAEESRFYKPGDGIITSLFPATGMNFAAALAAGPILPTGQDQIAVGVPRATVLGAAGAGAVVLISNPAAGGSNTAHFSQETVGVPGVAEPGDNFGAALAVGLLDGGTRAALVIGSPGESVDGEGGAGAVHVLTDITTPDFAAELWTQNDLFPSASEANDRFGAELAIGDFDADGLGDLAIGTPGETLGGAAGYGGGVVLYGSPAGVTANDLQYLPLGTVLVDEDLAMGTALAAGRFSGHAGDDLAITTPREWVGTEDDAGGVWIFPSVVLFLDGFESGGSEAWSYVEP